MNPLTAEYKAFRQRVYDYLFQVVGANEERHQWVTTRIIRDGLAADGEHAVRDALYSLWSKGLVESRLSAVARGGRQREWRAIVAQTGLLGDFKEAR